MLKKGFTHATKTQGFTLIELLVVISIIGILATLAIISFTGTQKQARDTIRKSDIKQYQNALEIFAGRNNGLYPSRTTSDGVQANSTLCSDLTLTNCPQDIRQNDDASFTYRYQSNGSDGGTADAGQHILWSKQEDKAVYFVVCSNGKVGEVSQSSWSNPSNGICPI